MKIFGGSSANHTSFEINETVAQLIKFITVS